MEYTFSIISEICSHLTGAQLCWPENKRAEGTVRMVRLLEDPDCCREDTLYILARQEDSQLGQGGSICSLTVPADRLLSVFAVLLDTCSCYDSWYERMLAACTQEDPVRQILKIGTEMFHNPIAHFDEYGNLICYEGHFDKDIAGTIWEPVLRYGYAPYEFYSIPEWRDISKIVTGTLRPVRMKLQKDPDHEIAGMGIAADHEIVGTIGITDINEPFSDAQMDILLIIREMLERAYHVKTRREPAASSGTVLGRLIRGDDLDAETMAQYLKSIGFTKNDRLCLIYMHDRGSSGCTRLRYFVQKVSQDLRGGRYCQMGDKGILLASAAAAVGPEPDHQTGKYKELDNIACKNDVFCLISAPFSELTSLRNSYFACRRADRVMNREGLYFYEDIFSQMMISRLLEEGNGSAYIHPLLAELAQKHPEKKSWIHELYIYLASGQNLALAASKCYTHRSTMAYHIERMEAYLATDLTSLSDDQWLYLLVSCRLLKTWNL